MPVGISCLAVTLAIPPSSRGLGPGAGRVSMIDVRDVARMNKSTSPRATVIAAITERDFESSVIELAQWLCWMTHAERPARTKDGWRTAIRGNPGFVDLVLCRPPRLLLVELKSARGMWGDDQLRWRDVLMGVPGVEYFCWRPADWEEIEATLR